MEVDGSEQGKAMIPLETGSGESMDLHTPKERTLFLWLINPIGF